MEIQKLIEVFKLLLPIYEKGYKENYSYVEMHYFNLHHGICNASAFHLKVKLYSIFCKNYYKNLINSSGFIFPLPESGKDLNPRIDFMKTEIKSLNKLLKEGYTHV